MGYQSVKIICYAVQMLFFMFIMTWKFRVVKHCFRSPSIKPLILLLVYIHHTHMHLEILAYSDFLFKLNLFNLNVSSDVFDMLLDPSIVFFNYTSNSIFKLTKYTNFQALKILPKRKLAYLFGFLPTLSFSPAFFVRG